ncbi:hypothetical protein LCGC14_0800850 [marine sediment metagenome]|uniref:CN hydrolase domain-containing protein n=1 Tax=marine sediment metagenome TaxID=412755 RepID=A0A0F9PU89_9ZZZZ
MEHFVFIGNEKTHVSGNSLLLQNRGIKKIEDIIGLNKLHDLVELNLSFNNIEDISSLESLINLQHLTITNNKITDMRGLSEYKNLKSLNLSYNQIYEINHLDSLQNLEELVLFRNGISKIENLESLKRLKTLRLDFNKINVISELEGLKNLQVLGLSENRISEIINLEELKNLKSLILSQNRISKIKGLGYNIKLEELYLYTNQISMIEGLSNLKKLKILYLFDNNIDTIEGLESLDKLEHLLLSNNNIYKINRLNNLIKLKRLELNQNEIVKIEGLDPLVNLEYLMIAGNEINIIEGLNSLKNLIGLSLDYNKILEISGLENLVSLQRLSLSNNDINKVSDIHRLTSLNHIDVQNNKISKLDNLINSSSTHTSFVNLLDNNITKSEEYVKLTHKLMIKVDINFFKLKEIRSKDISNLNILLDRQLNTEKYGYSSWVGRPFKISSDFDKEILDKIVHLFNTKLSMIRDSSDFCEIFDELLPFLQDRINLEQKDKTEYNLPILVRKLFFMVKENDINKKIEGINKIYENLKSRNTLDIVSIFSHSISILNIVNSILTEDLSDYYKNIMSLLNSLPEEYNFIKNFNAGNVDQVNIFINLIMHGMINIILEKIKNQTSILNANQIPKFIDNIKNPLLRDYLSQLGIEKITLDGPIEKLNSIRLYFAQMDLRYHYYDNEKGNFHNDYLELICQMIEENLLKSKNRNSNLIIFPEYSFPEKIIQKLIKYSKENDIWIIGGLERFDSNVFNLTIKENASIIISPSHLPILQKKHFKGKSEPELVPDIRVKIIQSKFGSFCILICADLLEPYLLSIIREQVDFIIVPSFNQDVNSFKYCAFDKCYSNMCYIIISNIVRYNESSIFAPFKGINRAVEMPDYPFIELNLTEFSQHRKRSKPILSSLYKRPLGESLYNLKL